MTKHNPALCRLVPIPRGTDVQGNEQQYKRLMSMLAERKAVRSTSLSVDLRLIQIAPVRSRVLAQP